MENYHASRVIQYFVFLSSKMGLYQVYFFEGI